MNNPQEYQKLTDFISKWIKPSDEDLEQLHSKLVIENYGKGDVLIKQGQICSSLKFVISGVYRVYQLNNGKEITSYFNYESRNPFIASFVSLLKAQPSNEIIECIVPGKVLSIKYSYWTALYNISQSFNTFGRLMAEFNYILAIERIESLQYLSASDRYEKFIKLYPDLLNMIPHHYISSYLGITPESLSRIRKVALKK
ncbi:Crp/Fnr family transcriptional regulator [Aquimarina sp. AD10]|uniref:Crp/Fnr family transcriptional regulator n=1 Tax=Aquimarina sp. AD10 TaxID=1714849 RepID=UPI000E490690|nr:Crp/Fnr family transcriptional regulator [Aquimarina sp. AD10]AXT59592.1 Crp/Fnr family transcriptional regulator [Aquimarina sp. AD10]RKM94727.1 Crp/Fnr family transcriptional regulator [Aquimarina sp. AD10]